MSTFQVDQNVKLSVEETHPDPRYVQLQDEEGHQTLLHQEIQGTLSVLRFPDASPTCLRRWITATSRVFRCWHCSDRNVQLSVEETVPCSHLSSVQPWVLNEDDRGMILHHIQPPS